MTIIRTSAALVVAFIGAVACSAAPQAEYAEAQPPAYAPAPYEAAPPAYTPPPYALPAYAQPRDQLDGAPHVSTPRRSASCDIRVKRTAQGVAITPVAMLDRTVAGEYDLVLTKDGASGSSDVTQGGPFNGRAGETVKLGQTELSLGRRDHYRVVLTLTDGRREICRSEVHS